MGDATARDSQPHSRPTIVTDEADEHQQQSFDRDVDHIQLLHQLSLEKNEEDVSVLVSKVLVSH